MFEIKTIAITDIAVPDRIRPVDEDHAQVIAASITANGLINPITIRSTPNAKDGKFTLVAGAHRLRACIINELNTIDAVIVKADQTTATTLEISENLFRNDLSVIDRAMFVQTLRDIYEQENGKITRGGDQIAKGQLAPLVENKSFSSYVSERLGLSADAVKRLNRISQNLNPVLREELRKNPLADNQSQLLKLAKMGQDDQQRTAFALKETNGDLKKALSLASPSTGTIQVIEQKDLQAGYLSQAIEAVSKMTSETYEKFEAFLDEREENEVAA